MKKRILSLLVALLMVVQLFSITALATDRTEEELTAEVIAEETVDHTIPAATEETAATSAEADAPAIPDAGDKPEVPETPEDSEIPEEPVAESKWQKGAESHWVNPMFKNSPALSNNDLSNAGDPIDRDLTMSDFTIHEKDIVAELSTAMVERKELVYLYYETYDMLTEEDLEDLLYKATVPSPYDHPSISNRSYGDYLMFSILEYAYTVEYIEMNGNYYNLILFGVSYLTTAEQEQELANRVVQIESEIYKDGLTRNSPEYLQLKAIYDYICANVKPATELSTEDLTPYTAYGALINGKALSQGYVMLFYYLCRTFELNNRIIYGTADGYDHVWNIVRIHNKWYNTDIFCDAVIGGYDYFLKGSTDFPDQHIPAPLYNTETFNQDYPIAEATYNPEQVFFGSVDNISWVFNELTSTLTISGSGPMPDDQQPWLNYSFPTNSTSIVVEEGITHIGNKAFSKEPPYQYTYYFNSITLPDSVVSIGDHAFEYTGRVESITLPKNLSSLGKEVFKDSGITEIVIPAKVSAIDSLVFQGSVINSLAVDSGNISYCTDGAVLYNKDKTVAVVAVPNMPQNAENFSLPENITTIGENAFYNCAWLNSISLPESITSIGENAFSNSSLNTLILPSSMTSIPERAFYGCNSLSAVAMPKSLQKIGNEAFCGCKIINIVLPDSVTSIGDYAFQGCRMYSAAIPTSVTLIGDGAFKDCQLTDIYYPGSAEQWASISIGNDNEVLTSATHNYGQWAVSQNYKQEFKLDLLTNEMVVAFSDRNSNHASKQEMPWNLYRDQIHSVTFVYPVNYSARYAVDPHFFEDCTNLTKVSFPADLDANFTIWHNAFANCSALETIQLPEQTSSIGSHAFENCSSLKSIEIPPNVDYLNEYTFANCTALERITIPHKLTEFVETAFLNCSAIKEIHTEHSKEKWNQHYNKFFENTDNITFYFGDPIISGSYGENVTWLYNQDTLELTVTGTGPIADCEYDHHNKPWEEWFPSITKPPVIKLVIEEGITSIGASSFSYNDFDSVVIPSTVTNIGSSAFANAMINELTLPENLKHIESNAFYSAWGFNRIILPEGLLTIGNHSIDMRHTKELYIPASVTSCGYIQAGYDLAIIYYGGTREQWKQLNIPNAGEENNPDFLICFVDSCIHEAKRLEKVPATCTDSGITEGYVCTKCDEVLKAQTEIEPKGHNYHDWNGVMRCYNCDNTIDPNIPLSGTCGEGLTWSFDVASGLLTIGGKGTMDNYSADAPAPWAVWKDHICKVQLPKDSSVGSYAFYDFDLLRSVNGTAITSIGSHTFAECDKLSAVNIKHMEVIGDGAFANTALTEVKLSQKTKSIGNGAFEGCALETVKFAGTEETWAELKIGENNAQLGDLLVFVEIEPDLPETSPFVDVAEKDYFFEPVLWAVQKGITGGISATQFAPNNACTRGQVVTFLWRAAGSPEPQSTSHPFSDISADKYYYKAVLWAVENSITSGLNATTFGPNNACTRGQIATFLWRANGSPEPQSSNNPFSDVNAGPFYKAILWAVEEGITTGYAGGTFRPGNVCTRGNIVTFLYRAYN